MKLKYLLPAALLAITIFNSCKKNKDDERQEQQFDYDYKLEYDGKTYVIDAGRVWDYKLNRYPSHNTRAYFMLNGKAFTQAGDYDLESEDPPISIFYYLSLPKEQSYLQGVFEFQELPVNWWETGLPGSAADKKVFTDGRVGFDANGDKKISSSEVFTVTGGTVKSNGGVEEYDLTLSNGKTLKGSVDAKLDTQLPPA